MFHLPAEILQKIYEYDSYKEDHWSHIISDIKISFLHSIEDEIFTIMTSTRSNYKNISSPHHFLTPLLPSFPSLLDSILIKPKLEICFGQNLDEFNKEINELILKTWKKDL